MSGITLSRVRPRSGFGARTRSFGDPRAFVTHVRIAVPRATCATSKSGAAGRTLLLLLALLWLGWPRPGISEPKPGAGTVILVGGVLRFNQRDVWSRIVGQAPELVIIAAAGDRPKLYGGFAQRALERHGAFAELLPVAVDPAEFGVGHRHATGDPALVAKVREAAGVFFVGGAPQRLAEVLFRADGSPTPMAAAVAEMYAAGGAVVGGVPGVNGLFTGIDAMEALATGRIAPARLHRGLGLMGEGWLVDQHAFTAGRFAEILVTMRQLGIECGLGVGADTAAVVEGGRLEVVGAGGVLLLDLSGSLNGTESRNGAGNRNEAGHRNEPESRSGSMSRCGAGSRSEYENQSQEASGPMQGFRLSDARLSYLEHGDRLDMRTLEVRPAAAKRDGFEIDPGAGERQPFARARPAAGELFARGRLLQLLHEAIDGPGGEASGFVFPEGEGGGGWGFRFRFHPRPETRGWLSALSGIERYTIVNLGLEIAPVRRKDVQDVR